MVVLYKLFWLVNIWYGDVTILWVLFHFFDKRTCYYFFVYLLHDIYVVF